MDGSPRGKKVLSPGLAVIDCKHLFRRHHFMVPKWDIRSHFPRQVVGLEGHYKGQGLSVPVRSVSPFSDPSSNLARSTLTQQRDTARHWSARPRLLVRSYWRPRLNASIGPIAMKSLTAGSSHPLMRFARSPVNGSPANEERHHNALEVTCPQRCTASACLQGNMLLRNCLLHGEAYETSRETPLRM